MSKKGMDAFVEKLRKDKELSNDLAELIAIVAQEAGCDVAPEDVKQVLLGDTPSVRPLPPRSGPPISTQAIGEEDKVSPREEFPITSAMVGEEDKRDRGVTTLAVGEEGKRPRDDFPITSMMVGEEDKKPLPRPLPPPGPTTLAIGEEDKPSPRDDFPISTMAVGEEDKIRRKPDPVPPPGKITTMAIGEEGKKPRP
jgi:hypothetical protein